jgi:hypothetical protein
MKKAITVLLLAISVSSCTSHRIISSDEFVDYGSNPINHTMYMGSDSDYHHFAWFITTSLGVTDLKMAHG